MIRRIRMFYVPRQHSGHEPRLSTSPNRALVSMLYVTANSFWTDVLPLGPQNSTKLVQQHWQVVVTSRVNIGVIPGMYVSVSSRVIHRQLSDLLPERCHDGIPFIPEDLRLTEEVLCQRTVIQDPTTKAEFHKGLLVAEQVRIQRLASSSRY